jgi:formylglycine-generating enzyme required for sulfatase activity
VKGLDTSDFPVETVSWEDAQTFLARLTALPQEEETGWTYRLPSEAEWEYSCRAGASSSTTFCFGNSLASTQANFNGDYPYGGAEKGPSLGRTCAVGSYRPNAFGLYDMHGCPWNRLRPVLPLPGPRPGKPPTPAPGGTGGRRFFLDRGLSIWSVEDRDRVRERASNNTFGASAFGTQYIRHHIPRERTWSRTCQIGWDCRVRQVPQGPRSCQGQERHLPLRPQHRRKREECCVNSFLRR